MPAIIHKENQLLKQLPVLLLILLLGITSNLLAQKTIVSGKVFDANTKEPMPFVNLVFDGTKTGASTDLDGNFRIETYYASDSLVASFIGYKTMKMPVKLDREQVVDFAMESSDVQVAEVVIAYKGNPAHKILDRVIRNKEVNNRKKYDAYEYEVYNKVEFDLNNVTQDFQNKKMFKKFQFIFDYIDTTEEKDFLPMFMTEAISDYYYKRDPKSEKEVIKATKVSGVSNESISQFLGDMYQNVNVYENHIGVFGKSFVSPIADFGKRYYKYYLIDSLVVDGKYCYQIDFKPKHKQEPVFSGTMFINDTTYAIKRIRAKISENANINFVNSFDVEQEYENIDKEYWMLKKDRLVVDFTIGENIMGLYGRKSTSYKNFVMDKPRSDDFYNGVENVIVLEDASVKSDEFWQGSRHDSLTENQVGIYQMVDSVKKVPAFRSLVDIVQLLFTGYKEVGKFEIGPYFKLYSFNKVEGHRFRLGGRTSNNFSTRFELNGYGAYGLTDNRFKYSAGFRYMLSKQPRQVLSFQYKNDLEQLGISQNAFSTDNILSSFLRRNPNDKLTNIEEYKVSLEREWLRGLSNRLILNTRDMQPLGRLRYDAPDPEGGLRPRNHIRTAEVALYTRFAYKERYVDGEFTRVSLGSKYPIVELQVGFGFDNLLQGQFNYQKAELAVSDEFSIGVMGKTEYRITAGKYWGKLPYPLLEIHNGNETYFYDELAFNLMNFFEFISDEYSTVMLTHHFDGYFFNKIPLFRKLKWREVVAGRAVIGNLSDKHQEVLVLPENMFRLTKPYVEVAAGVENILKVIRVDALWRLSYLDNPEISKFGIRGAFEFTF